MNRTKYLKNFFNDNYLISLACTSYIGSLSPFLCVQENKIDKYNVSIMIDTIQIDPVYCNNFDSIRK